MLLHHLGIAQDLTNDGILFRFLFPTDSMQQGLQLIVCISMHEEWCIVFVVALWQLSMIFFYFSIFLLEKYLVYSGRCMVNGNSIVIFVKFGKNSRLIQMERSNSMLHSLKKSEEYREYQHCLFVIEVSLLFCSCNICCYISWCGYCCFIHSLVRTNAKERTLRISRIH